MSSKNFFLLTILTIVLRNSSITVTVKKEGWGGGGTRSLNFTTGGSDIPVLKPSGKTLNVSIGPGLPKDTSKYLRERRAKGFPLLRLHNVLASL